MSTSSLARSTAGSLAEAARAAYRTVLRAILIVEAAAGLSLIFWPATLARILDAAAAPPYPWPRLAGLLILVLGVLFFAGSVHPDRAKIANLIGLVGRALIGLLLILMGAPLLFAGAFELVAALVLAALYFRYFSAEVMNRP